MFHGYVMAYAPDHPSCRQINERRAAKANGGPYHKWNYVREHRLVMERHLGRYLRPEEVVHHINSQKTDNRLENLMLFANQAEHIVFERTGRSIPAKWTEAGKERIRESNRRRAANARLRREQDAAQTLQTTLR